MKILFTGASGFLGDNIAPTLSKYYEIDTIGLSDKDTYCINLAEKPPILKNNYEIVLHAAGKAHFIPKTQQEIQSFYDVNLQGTKNLCSALEKATIPKSFIFISTVAVYGIDSGEFITEDHPLNGRTPYALSKIQAEIFLHEWCTLHKVILGIIRPSLIAGENPPGNLGAMIKGIKSGKYFCIGYGRTRKSVIMAKDIAFLVPSLAKIGGVYNLTDDYHPSFRELELLIANQLHKNAPITIPYWLAKIIALFGDMMGRNFSFNSLKLDKIVNPLTFSNEKAKRNLDWKPLNVLQNFKIH